MLIFGQVEVVEFLAQSAPELGRVDLDRFAVVGYGELHGEELGVAAAAVGALFELLFELGEEPNLDGGGAVGAEAVVDVEADDAEVALVGASEDEDAWVDR